MIITVSQYKVIPTSRDAIQYSLYLEDDAGNKQVITTYCSGTLKAIWGIDDNDELFKSLYPRIRKLIAEWISKGVIKSINGLGPIVLTTHDAPKVAPTERYVLPDRIEIKKIELEPLDTYAVFICHASSDKRLANHIKQFLEDFHIKSFVAHDDIELGDIWEPTIIETVRNSKIMIIVGSKDIENSPWVNFETGLAYDKMFPILFDKLTDKVSYIKNKQGININYGDVGSDLLKLINKVLAKLGLNPEKEENEIILLPSFNDLKNEIVNRKSMEKVDENKANQSDNKRFYIYRTTKGIYELAEIFNKSNEDLIDLNIILDYDDKLGVHQKIKAKVINHDDDPLNAKSYRCQIMKRNETKYIANFPRVTSKVIIQGIEANSNLKFTEEHIISNEE